jgi:hypothetical protein
LIDLVLARDQMTKQRVEDFVNQSRSAPSSILISRRSGEGSIWTSRSKDEGQGEETAETQEMDLLVHERAPGHPLDLRRAPETERCNFATDVLARRWCELVKLFGGNVAPRMMSNVD